MGLTYKRAPPAQIGLAALIRVFTGKDNPTTPTSITEGLQFLDTKDCFIDRAVLGVE